MAGDIGLSQPQPSYIDTPEANTDEAMQAAHSVPWVGIAFAVHVLLLVVAWFVLPAATAVQPLPPLQAMQDPVTEPPPPLQEPEKESVFPDDHVDKEVTSDHKIVTEDDTHSEDPTDSPNKDIAVNPNENPTPAESPNPNHKNSNSAVGLGPNGGGGGGQGGEGGMYPHRGPGPGGKKKKPEVEAGLQWLADHQNREGYWSATTFNQDSKRTGAHRTYNIEFVRPGEADGDKGWEGVVDVGLTGLALLAFTTAGYDHKTGDYRNTIRQAVIYLRKVQSNDGCFGAKDDDHFVYNHSICMMALAEVYGLSLDLALKPLVERAVDFALRAQNPGMGWRYDIARGTNDSSVTGWMVLALHTCEYVGVHFDNSKVYGGAAAWFDMVTVDVNGYPRTGYDSPGSPCSRLRSAMDVYDQTPSMDAIYIMSMLFMGKAELGDSKIRALARGCVERDNLPQWTHSKLDMYYWYYASLALYQVGGNVWDTWRNSVMKVLMDNQRGFHPEDKKAGRVSKELLAEHGSWDAVDAWSSCGGRVYATAMGVLTLESVKRYERLQGK